MTISEIDEKCVNESFTETSKPLSVSFSEEDILELSEDSAINHAQQLLLFLKRKQKEIDHRESVLNSQIAYFESKIRNVNLIIQTSKEELLERETELNSLADQLESEKKDLSEVKRLFYERSRKILDELAAQKKDLLKMRSEILIEKPFEV